ncbi:hypothetical protein ANO11243_055560 [Dothideomycetidae sp. 11243]|nr:hypothetical protein ANO11243_055560 [fungal sp. No.11243]
MRLVGRQTRVVGNFSQESSECRRMPSLLPHRDTLASSSRSCITRGAGRTAQMCWTRGEQQGKTQIQSSWTATPPFPADSSPQAPSSLPPAAPPSICVLHRPFIGDKANPTVHRSRRTRGDGAMETRGSSLKRPAKQLQSLDQPVSACIRFCLRFLRCHNPRQSGRLATDHKAYRCHDFAITDTRCDAVISLSVHIMAFYL